MIDTLFEQVMTSALAADAFIKPTPGLPAGAYLSGEDRKPADPIGMRGLPNLRSALNALLVQLCRRVISAGPRGVTGSRLATELCLHGTRPIRLLVSYGHVHHRIRELVGLPGSGYFWGSLNAALYGSMREHAKRMGRAWFFLSSLYGRGSTAVEAAQLMLDFVSHAGDQAGCQGTPPRDELEILMASEGVKIEHVLSAIMDQLTETEDGRQALAQIGRAHAQVLLPKAEFDSIIAQATALSASVARLRVSSPTDQAVNVALTPEHQGVDATSTTPRP